MGVILDLAQNPIAAACVISWLVAQLGKATLAFLKKKRWEPSMLVADGGMPSSHVALASSLAFAILFLQGANVAFMVSAVVALIVARDAIGVRRAVGDHARMLSTPKKKARGEDEGHDLGQVAAGFAIGFFIPLIVITKSITLLFLLKVIYLMLPGIFATMVPVVIASYMKSMGIPLDFKFKIGDHRIFGDNKTFIGFFAGVAAAIVIADIQTRLSVLDALASISLIPYSRMPFMLVGLVIGFGAMGGDLIKSFVKRRLGIADGKPFFPFDQIDGALGVLILATFYYSLPLSLIIAVLFLAFALHLLISSIGIVLGIKKSL